MCPLDAGGRDGGVLWKECLDALAPMSHCSLHKSQTITYKWFEARFRPGFGRSIHECEIIHMKNSSDCSQIYSATCVNFRIGRGLPLGLVADKSLP